MAVVHTLQMAIGGIPAQSEIDRHRDQEVHTPVQSSAHSLFHPSDVIPNTNECSKKLGTATSLCHWQIPYGGRIIVCGRLACNRSRRRWVHPPTCRGLVFCRPPKENVT